MRFFEKIQNKFYLSCIVLFYSLVCTNKLLSSCCWTEFEAQFVQCKWCQLIKSHVCETKYMEQSALVHTCNKLQFCRLK